MGPSEMQNFKKLFRAPIGKFRLIVISDNFLEEEPQIRDFQSIRKAEGAADRESNLGRAAEVYDSNGDFIYQGKPTAG